jgi:hypothetical protein
MKQRKWLYIALICLTVINIGAFVLIWQSGDSPGNSSDRLRSMPHVTQSATAAAAVLQTWLTENGPEDGAVVACTLTLGPTITTNGWTFQVYSAKQNRLLVAVVQDRDVRVLRNIAALYRPTVLPATAWKQSSDAVMKIWWREGGSTAWNRTADITLTAHLGMREDATPSWQLTVANNKKDGLEYWEICAATGALLERSSIGGQ